MNAHVPSFEAFRPAYDAGKPQIVARSLVADLDTPVSAWLKLGTNDPYSFLLESVQGGEIRGRYSIIGLKPDLIWRCRGRQAELNVRADQSPDAFVPEPKPPLDSLRDLLARTRMEIPAPLPPMASGLFGYLGHDMVRLMERLPEPNPDPLGLPDAVLVRPTVVAIFDAVKADVTIATPVFPANGVSARAAYDQAEERLSAVAVDFARNRIPEDALSAEPVTLTEPVSNTTRAEYLDIVRRAKDYIAAGDIFQVVPSQRFRRPFNLPPFQLYRTLRRLNPSPFLFFLNYPGYAAVGSSPEILVRLRDGTVTIRPIAGTIRRGTTPEEDKALAEHLLADPKERAEHLMLLDLGRNDVGRVVRHREIQPRSAHRLERRRPHPPRQGRARRIDRRISERHDQRCSENPRPRNHRRAGKGKARCLRRRCRLLLRQRLDGHLHCAAHRDREGRHDVRPSRRRRRRRQRSRRRVHGDGLQIRSSLPRRRRSPTSHRRQAQPLAPGGLRTARQKQTQSDPSRRHIGGLPPFLPSRSHHLAVTCDSNCADGECPAR
jgi:anthranilate synthase component 1